MSDSPVVVAQVVQSLGHGGLEQVVLDLARSLDRRRFVPHVFALSNRIPLADAFAAEAIPVTVVAQQGLDFGLPKRLARAFREAGVGLVHAHNFGRYFYAGPAARRVGLPALYSEHSNTRPDERALWLTQRWLSRTASSIAAVSENVRGYLVERQKLPPARVVVVPNGIDIAAFAAPRDRAAIRAELGLPAESLVIGTVGRMVPVKNHALLLDAFQLVAARVPTAHLLICGDGLLRQVTEARAEELGLAERVTFTGLRRDVPRVLAALDVFCLSSDSEGLPLAILEALAAGLPVVATAVGGVPELITEAVGRLAPPAEPGPLADELVELLGDEGLRAQLSQTAREVVARSYSIEAMVARYVELYQQALGR